MRRILIDTDTGSDDAVALIIALRDPEVKVEAITVVAGNVPLDQAVQNALYTVALCEQTTPVFAGAISPLIRPLETGQFVHGEDGMGDIGLDLQGRRPASGQAKDVILETFASAPGEIELVTLGPLTNVALALAENPALAKQIKQCTVMGGIGKGHGNITKKSEFNIWEDPEAADVVFKSGMPLRMVGWDISRNYAWIGPEEKADMKALDSELAHFTLDIQSTLEKFAVDVSKLPGFDLPDPIAMAIALDPSLIEVSKELYVEIVKSEGATRGQTLVDHTGNSQRQANTEVVLEASRKKFLHKLYQSLI